MGGSECQADGGFGQQRASEPEKGCCSAGSHPGVEVGSRWHPGPGRSRAHQSRGEILRARSEGLGLGMKRLHATDITSPGTNTPEAGTWFNNSVTRATAKESISERTQRGPFLHRSAQL